MPNSEKYKVDEDKKTGFFSRIKDSIKNKLKNFLKSKRIEKNPITSVEELIPKIEQNSKISDTDKENILKNNNKKITDILRSHCKQNDISYPFKPNEIIEKQDFINIIKSNDILGRLLLSDTEIIKLMGELPRYQSYKTENNDLGESLFWENKYEDIDLLDVLKNPSKNKCNNLSKIFIDYDYISKTARSRLVPPHQLTEQIVGNKKITLFNDPEFIVNASSTNNFFSTKMKSFASQNPNGYLTSSVGVFDGENNVGHQVCFSCKFDNKGKIKEILFCNSQKGTENSDSFKYYYLPVLKQLEKSNLLSDKMSKIMKDNKDENLLSELKNKNLFADLSEKYPILKLQNNDACTRLAAYNAELINWDLIKNENKNIFTKLFYKIKSTLYGIGDQFTTLLKSKVFTEKNNHQAIVLFKNYDFANKHLHNNIEKKVLKDTTEESSKSKEVIVEKSEKITEKDTKIQPQTKLSTEQDCVDKYANNNQNNIARRNSVNNINPAIPIEKEHHINRGHSLDNGIQNKLL